jgi:hypothetical protein
MLGKSPLFRALTRLSALLALAPLLSVLRAEAQTVRPEFCGADAQVEAMAISGNTLYIGGQFRYVGRFTGPAITMDPVTGQVSASSPRVGGVTYPQVFAVAPDGSGGWYIGGYFTTVNGLPRTNIAHILADHSVDSWNPGADGAIDVLLVSGSTMYVGGPFTSFGGLSRNMAAAFDLNTGAVTSWNPNVTGGFSPFVDALATDGTTVYVGGSFSSIGGQPRASLGAVDASTGAVSGWNPSPSKNSSPPPVYIRGLTVSGSLVYAVGNFNSVSFVSHNGVAAIDKGTGVATSWNPQLDPNVVDVYTALAIGSTVYLGGGFVGQGRQGLGAFDATTAIVTSWNPAHDGSVEAMLQNGSNLYVAGGFSTMGGQPRINLAELSLATGNATSWDPGGTDFHGVRTIAFSGSEVCAGGDFRLAGGKVRNAIAAIDLTTGTLLPNWDPAPTQNVQSGSTSPEVQSLAISGSLLYVGGGFGSIGGQPRLNLAALDLATGNATSWNPGCPGANSNACRVLALAVNGSVVYAGGNFFSDPPGQISIGGQARNYIAALDASTGLATAWNPNANSQVRALVTNGTTVFAGGYFTAIGGQSRNMLAALDPATGLVTAPDFLGATGAINAFVLNGSTLYAGGQFSAIGGAARNNLAALSISTGNATAWNPNAGYQVWALSLNGPTIYPSGSFGTMGGLPRSGIAAVDVATGSVLPWDASTNGTDYAVLASGTSVYVGGGFNTVAGIPGGGGLAAVSDAVLAVPDVGSGGPATLSLTSHPNPFRLSSELRFVLPRDERVTIGVYDLAGRKLTTLVNGERYTAGPHAVRFEPKGLPGGVYVFRVRAGEQTTSRRVVLLP